MHEETFMNLEVGDRVREIYDGEVSEVVAVNLEEFSHHRFIIIEEDAGRVQYPDDAILHGFEKVED